MHKNPLGNKIILLKQIGFRKVLLENYLFLMFLLLTIFAIVLYLEFIPYENKSIYSFFSGFLFLKWVIFYIVSLEILKFSINKWEKKDKFEFDQNQYTKMEIKLLSLIAAFPFGLGVTSFFNGLSKKRVETLPISQGIAISIVLFPTTPASAYVLDYYRISAIYEVFIIGLPIVIAMIFSLKEFHVHNLIKTKFLILIISIGILNFIYIATLSFFVDGYFLLKESIFYLFLSLYFNKHFFRSVINVIIKTKKEILFFMGIGILGNTLLLISNYTNYNFDSFLIVSDFIIILPIVMLPLLSIFFIPPFVLFIVFVPYITSLLSINGYDNNLIYIIWIIMLTNAQLLSPVSLTTILAAKNSQSNIFAESIFKHYKFCFKLSVVSCLYLVLYKYLI